jgi:hypothetical protein
MANQNIKQRAEKTQNANIYSQTQLGLTYMQENTINDVRDRRNLPKVVTS